MKRKVGRPLEKAPKGLLGGNGIQRPDRKPQPKEYNKSDPTFSRGRVRGYKLLLAMKALGLTYTDIKLRIMDKHALYIPSVKNITEYCRNDLPMDDKVLKLIINVINEYTKFGYRSTLTPPLTLEDCREVGYGATIKQEFQRLRRDNRKKGNDYNKIFDKAELYNELP